MAKKAAKKVPVSERAALQRINRKLAKDGELLRKLPERSRERTQPWAGKYCLIDSTRNCVLNYFDDLSGIAATTGVLKAWEEITE